MDVEQALRDCASWTALPNANEAAHVLAAEVKRLRANIADARTRFYANRTDDYATGWRDALHYAERGTLDGE